MNDVDRKFRSLVSVIVPVYKTENYLDQCVQSIVDQTYRNLEIILVDDGSPDRCPQMCDDWAQRDSRIRVIHQINRGLSSARNRGLAVASGEWILFVDSDDWISGNLLRICLDNEQSDVIAFDFQNTNSACVRSSFNRFEEPNIPITMSGGDAFALYLKPNFLPVMAWTLLVKRQLYVINDIKFPEGRSFEDVGTTYKIIGAALEVSFIQQPLYFYRQREESIMHQARDKFTYHDLESSLANINEIEDYVHRFRPDLAKQSVAYCLNMLVIVICLNLFVPVGQEHIRLSVLFEIFEKYYKKCKDMRDFSRNNRIKIWLISKRLWCVLFVALRLMHYSRSLHI